MDRSLFTRRELAERISGWIKLYTTHKAKASSLVVGVSGGIDSALVSTLCAMTGIKTFAVVMPIRQSSEQHSRAVDHVDWLVENYPNVSPVILGLDRAFSVFELSLREEGFESALGFANSRSRLRMMALYQIATSESGLVVGTGNKVEDFGVGFFTKYGDGGVDISPIGNFNKTEVRELAIELGIADSILKAKPSDGLWDDERSDEDQIGATYEELEWAMNHLEGEPVDEENLSDRQLEVLNIYINFHKKNLHKINPIPVFEI